MNKIEQWMNSWIGLNFRSGLDRMEQAVSLLGRPDKAYPILHVTGTNREGIHNRLSASIVDGSRKESWDLYLSSYDQYP